eukprot:CAMPEP_0196742930 /NCGR_PEP_ID=MMETSP1091-20130531/49581_1 /TAXON_ID=302021 /ORGANISM="Rhodomonas sp., Strain CCMP768" /LENGTH=119 /DNA_ID=CAMNT_0042089119 /DNA_START=20 /DNA_END=375 /DNA_ORIENTATION=+
MTTSAAMLPGLHQSFQRPAFLSSDTEPMRLRGGMGDAAAQMAEIRAQRAKEYQAMKAQKEDSQARQAKEEAEYDGAQRSWTHASSSIEPKTIGTKQDDMAIGDARAFYKGTDVTYLRNR